MRIQDFPRRGRQPPNGGGNIYFLPMFEKLHKIENILARMGLDPPLYCAVHTKAATDENSLNALNGLFTLRENGSQSENDQRKNDKHQRKFSYSLSLGRNTV